MPSKPQIKMLQTAVRAAGLRSAKSEGRYRLLLAQYKRPGGKPVESCKQLNHRQLEDMLAICESYGWRMPGKAEDYFRRKRNRQDIVASFAQQEAIKHLAGDLGWNEFQVGGLIKRITGDKADSLAPNPREFKIGE